MRENGVDMPDPSLGVTRGQIRVQFVAESLLLSAIGGIAGFYPAVRAARMSHTEALATP
ncbi:hypothetical protein [Nonomuraea diastatica]|uniref:hypothetical protein n=1 Tax=Nonomuraea diastatica TaxID=1848329 RepID=UPI001FE36750|nr:hypothetical protein [Nonomuraea diastatica]